MAHSHAQLEQMLDALDESVPRLVLSKPAPEDFWASFQAMAQAIQDRAQPSDRAWVCDRLDAIQVKHQLVPPADQI
jgi:hypothetical protein